MRPYATSVWSLQLLVHAAFKLPVTCTAATAATIRCNIRRFPGGVFLLCLRLATLATCLSPPPPLSVLLLLSLHILTHNHTEGGGRMEGNREIEKPWGKLRNKHIFYNKNMPSPSYIELIGWASHTLFLSLSHAYSVTHPQTIDTHMYILNISQHIKTRS
jgi:hypothetical protein